MEKLVSTPEIVKLTDRAAERVKEYIAREGKPSLALRVKAERDACNCLSYGLELEEIPAKKDLVFESNGVKVVVDPGSAELVRGAQIDYVKRSGSEGFRISGGECGPGCGCS